MSIYCLSYCGYVYFILILYLIIVNSNKFQNVVAAIIKKDNLYLIAKRNRHKHLGLKWEFPGGKVNLKETFEEVYKRN